LLKLRKVELVGFKSFCEKTHLTFSGTGLSCIIGPNGCGKSNIVDAISWVLGEQSHKMLRAERMADCIFNGTAKRPPMGLAEVTLTLVDTELAEAARRVLGDSEPVSISSGVAAVPSEGVDDDALTHSGGGNDIAEGAPIEIEAEQDAAPEDKSPKKGRRTPKQLAQMRPGEVVIGRRLYRSGQSEYLLNGRPARLRDVQELFMGIGLGPDSYAIIEQGRIGQVLSSKPSDRRAIIEEAAGITKYKTKKRLAEAKLDSSKVNLSRVNDIFVEVEKQLASLKRQASKARRYAELREQMRGLLRVVLANKARRLENEAERLTIELAGMVEKENEQAQVLSGLEGEQERLDRRVYELETELRQNQNLIGQAALELDRAENRIVFNRQRQQELAERAVQLNTERQEADDLLAQIESRIAAQDEIAGKLQEEMTSVESVLAELNARSLELCSAHTTAETQIAESRRRIQEFEQSLAQIQEIQAQAEQLVAHHSGALERLEKSERELLEESVEHRENSQAADMRWQAATESASVLEESVAEGQQRVADYRRYEAETASRCDTMRHSLAAVRARHHALNQLLSDRSYTTETVQKLFASPNAAAGDSGCPNFRAVGLLADYAEVAAEHETAIEQFLKDELEYVVVETFDHARAGIELLRNEFGGRATFFVDSLRSLPVRAPDTTVPFSGEPDVSRLDRLVEFRDPLGPAAKQFLPRLHSAFLVATRETAERLAPDNPSYIFLTPDGTSYQGRAMTGGRATQAGPLALKRELRELEAETSRLETESSELHATLERLRSERQQAERSLADLTVEHVEAAKKVAAATVERDQARLELARLSAELAACQSEVERLRRDTLGAKQKSERAVAERESILNARSNVEEELAHATALVVEMRNLTQAHQDALATKRADKAALTERLSNASAVSIRIKEEQDGLFTRISALAARQTAVKAEEEEILRQIGEHSRLVESLRSERELREKRQAELDREFNQTRSRTAEVDNDLRVARQTLTDLREQRNRHEIDRARNDADREYLRTTCISELNAPVEELTAQPQALPLNAEELAASEAQYHEIKARVEGMGPVNMMALEEYNECEQRFGFLERERADLLQSISDTQQTIAELDRVSRQKFEEAFAIINTHFAGAFETLFGGGTGQMRLSEADSSGEAGIDIAAQPPGKRLQNVLLLSGGEKALTALALLIAVFRYQPSPFCILDEVDAPLDESNVGRFAQMVAEMSADAQFIVVTHNRRTMEMASVLYGVTMQEPGVSKLVSVNWEEARSSASHAA
jgi:chromosome segregation protein